MYKIEKKTYGYKLTFSDSIDVPEMKKWIEDSKKALISSPKSFGVFIDMQDLKPLSAEAQKLIEEGQKLYHEKGMTKSVVILKKVMTKLQFQRLARESGIYKFERYIDVTSNPNWEKAGIDWISKGIDPDK